MSTSFVDLLVHDKRDTFSLNHRDTNNDRVLDLAAKWEFNFETIPVYAIATQAFPTDNGNNLLFDESNNCYHDFFKYDAETCQLVDSLDSCRGKTTTSKYIDGISRVLCNKSLNLSVEEDRLSFLRQVLSDSTTQSISYGDLKKKFQLMCPLRIDPLDGQHRLKVMNKILNDQLDSDSYDPDWLRKRFRVIILYSPTNDISLDTTFLEKSALFSMKSCTNYLQGKPVEPADRTFQMINLSNSFSQQARWGVDFFSKKTSKDILGM